MNENKGFDAMLELSGKYFDLWMEALKAYDFKQAEYYNTLQRGCDAAIFVYLGIR